MYLYFFGLENFKSLQFSYFYKNSETQVLRENLLDNIDQLLESRLSSEQLYLLAADLSSKEFYGQSSRVYKEFIDKDLVDICCITYIKEKYNCDTFFPSLPNEWKLENVFFFEIKNVFLLLIQYFHFLY